MKISCSFELHKFWAFVHWITFYNEILISMTMQSYEFRELLSTTPKYIQYWSWLKVKNKHFWKCVYAKYNSFTFIISEDLSKAMYYDLTDTLT